MNTDLTGRTAVVCGSTQGIGRAAAEEIAQLGATVILLARDAEALQQVATQLPKPHGQSHSFGVADFQNPQELQTAAQKIADQGAVEILVNNTGGPPGGTALEASAAEYESAFQLHLIGNQLLTQAFVPGMKQRSYGRIVNIISTSVKQPIPGLGVSNTVRGAVASWAKTLANELGPFGITVNNVLPGFTDTARLHAIIRQRSQREGVSEDQVAEQMRASVPCGRFGETGELGSAVAFLVSPAASYISGINLPVDGGRTSCL